MTRFATILVTWVVALFALAAPVHAEPGRLLIVGGGLSLDNEAIYSAFLAGRPEDRPGIAIIAAASTDASAQASTFAGELMFYGVDPEDVAIVRLAVVDDPDTPDVDESDWVANAANPEEIAKIENAGAIWFTGGDQLRLNRALVRPGGIDSLMLAAIRQRLADGAIIGGTSAGAAAMSSPMIARGYAYGGLFLPIASEVDEETEGELPLTLMPGLRLFSPFILDQHFGQRGRIGRLARAIMEQPQGARIGLGVDENTALLVNLAENSAEVIGRGAVTLLDGRGARLSNRASTVQIEDIRMSRLHGGDRLDLVRLTVEPSSDRAPVENRRSVLGAVRPNIDMLATLETERRPLNESEYLRGGSARFLAVLAQGKRRAEFRFETDGSTRAWRSPTDEGWAGTVTGVRFSLTAEEATP